MKKLALHTVNIGIDSKNKNKKYRQHYDEGKTILTKSFQLNAVLFIFTYYTVIHRLLIQ